MGAEDQSTSAESDAKLAECHFPEERLCKRFRQIRSIGRSNAPKIREPRGDQYSPRIELRRSYAEHLRDPANRRPVALARSTNARFSAQLHSLRCRARPGIVAPSSAAAPPLSSATTSHSAFQCHGAQAPCSSRYCKVPWCTAYDVPGFLPGTPGSVANPEMPATLPARGPALQQRWTFSRD